jgi:solute carrier family 1 (glial high affinity glutamate transporter), member 2
MHAGPAAETVVQSVHVINAAVSKMVAAALWASPLGVGSLIAASILRACNLWQTAAALGLWAATVVIALAVFGLLILPALLLALTGRSPIKTAKAFAQSLLLAFGTSSSAASLPLAMQAARDLGCDDAVVSVFLPMGVAINMNGTALYEAVTAIFIAQAHGVALGFAELLTVATTASLAAVGAPAIPSAGLVTMMIVLQAVGLDAYAGDLAAILALDWALDRVRTVVNLLGDGFGCVAVDAALKRGGARGGDRGQKLSRGEGVGYVQLAPLTDQDQV